MTFVIFMVSMAVGIPLCVFCVFYFVVDRGPSSMCRAALLSAKTEPQEWRKVGDGFTHSDFGKLRTWGLSGKIDECGISGYQFGRIHRVLMRHWSQSTIDKIHDRQFEMAKAIISRRDS